MASTVLNSDQVFGCSTLLYTNSSNFAAVEACRQQHQHQSGAALYVIQAIHKVRHPGYLHWPLLTVSLSRWPSITQLWPNCPKQTWVSTYCIASVFHLMLPMFVYSISWHHQLFQSVLENRTYSAVTTTSRSPVHIDIQLGIIPESEIFKFTGSTARDSFPSEHPVSGMIQQLCVPLERMIQYADNNDNKPQATACREMHCIIGHCRPARR